MNTLWARAAQVRSTCRCSLCASPANALARRANRGSVRRGIRQEDVFLVFSSTIAFEAAVIDSVRKDARSKQWDKVIEEGKEQVEAIEADQKSRVRGLLDRAEQRLVQDANQQQDALRDRGKTLFRMDESKLDWSWQGLMSWTAKRDELRVATGFEDWKGPPLNLLINLTAPELRTLATDKRVLNHFYGGVDCENLEDHPARPPSTKKLRTLEWSIAKLVLRMLWTVCGENSYKQLTSIPTKYLTSVIPLEDASSFNNSWNDKLVQANAKLDQLYSHWRDFDNYDYFERPAAPSYDANVQALEDELIHLNTTLHATLQEMKAKEKMDSLMARICQNLLLSRAHPDIHTYNLLLVRFCQLGEKSLAHFVLESMRESHVRPNEITHATILRFYTATGNKKDFSLYVKRMRGLKGGVALANPRRTLSPLVRSRVHLFGIGLRGIAQKARMNQEVFTVLIIGLLRFFDSEDAIYWYRAMIDQGWRPTAELLVAILRQCSLRGDWDGGMAVWQQFSKETLQVSVVAYEWMLRLCQRCQQYQVYSSIFDEGIRRGILTVQILTRDIGALLAQAQNDVVSQLDQKAIAAPLRKWLGQLRTFAATEGHHHLLDNVLLGSPCPDLEINRKVRSLVEDVRWLKALRSSIARHKIHHHRLENALLGSPCPDLKINRKVRSLVEDARWLKALRSSIARHKTTFNEVNPDKIATVDGVNTLPPSVGIRQSVLKFEVSAMFSEFLVEDSLALLLALHDHYENTSTSKLEWVLPPPIPPEPRTAPGVYARVQPRLKGFHELSDATWSGESHLIKNMQRLPEAIA